MQEDYLREARELKELAHKLGIDGLSGDSSYSEVKLTYPPSSPGSRIQRSGSERPPESRLTTIS